MGSLRFLSFPCEMKYFFLLSICFCSTGYFAQKSPDQLMNDWHKAAASANFNAYFEVTHDHFVFLGTAPGERWTKTEFQRFCKPYFDKGKAWNFIPTNRNWNYNADSTMAWFDEELKTWMEGCRGSGVLTKTGNEWKISYYNLTVLIENEKIQKFIKLRRRK